jgi:DNA ligase D-like protein (predicted ligase)/DNA ligase D-like protein (predicted 3'-phosphoesterase)
MSLSHTYKPMLAKEAAKPFSGKDWIFEIKWDGYRVIAYVNDAVSLRSRNDRELIDNFPELKELKKLARNVVLDGEIVVVKNGKADFQALQERGKAVKESDIQIESLRQSAQYVVFDILEKDGKSLLNLPLMERKKILRESVKEGQHVVLNDFIEEKGEEYYKAALERGIEGVMAKRKDSTYQQGLRTGDWLKFKRLQSCDCVVFGYTKGTGARAKRFGALILGLYDGKGPIFVGKVGTGFTEKMLQDLVKMFKPLETSNKPFKPTDVPEEITWLKPKLVAEVYYQVVTNDGKLRMPRFHGLRKDKSPNECTVDQLSRKEPATNSLTEYLAKRDFSITSEPAGKEKTGGKQTFVVQEHHARRLHWDFRLEKDGVLKSWAVPKGIPENTKDKRLAVETEDHPLEYAKFAGTIPAGQYGAGTVTIWDHGTFDTKIWDEKMIEVTLHGERLKGRYVLVRLKRAGEKSWLMLKGKEE